MKEVDGSKLTELRERLTSWWSDARKEGLELELAADLGRYAREAVAVEPGATRAGVPARMGLVGDSPALHAALDLVERVAASDVPVLILGETGTGKELVARALHDHSARRKKPFFAENCAAVPAELLESEFFGHKRGSFTGAIADRPGHFVAADGGTVFLDEIGDMPLPMQAKLLRVLQDGEVRAVGTNRSVHVDVRVVAATNKDLGAMCAAREFREDLYFRLNVVTIRLPPLRERTGDVRHLLRYFLEKAAEHLPQVPAVAPEAIAALEAWRWPGNVRELENEAQRAVALSQGTISLSDLSPHIASGV